MNLLPFTILAIKKFIGFIKQLAMQMQTWAQHELTMFQFVYIYI